MMGYENYEAPIWAIESPLTVRLHQHTTVLQEVVVKDSLTGGDILRIALSRIEQNFPMKPFFTGRLLPRCEESCRLLYIPA